MMLKAVVNLKEWQERGGCNNTFPFFKSTNGDLCDSGKKHKHK